MFASCFQGDWVDVASRAEAWIETLTVQTKEVPPIASPPVRRRGLKQFDPHQLFLPIAVASRAEAWIETPLRYGKNRNHFVASRAEAWIETGKCWIGNTA